MPSPDPKQVTQYVVCQFDKSDEVKLETIADAQDAVKKNLTKFGVTTFFSTKEEAEQRYNRDKDGKIPTIMGKMTAEFSEKTTNNFKNPIQMYDHAKVEILKSSVPLQIEQKLESAAAAAPRKSSDDPKRAPLIQLLDEAQFNDPQIKGALSNLNDTLKSAGYHDQTATAKSKFLATRLTDVWVSNMKSGKELDPTVIKTMQMFPEFTDKLKEKFLGSRIPDNMQKQALGVLNEAASQQATQKSQQQNVSQQVAPNAAAAAAAAPTPEPQAAAAAAPTFSRK